MKISHSNIIIFSAMDRVKFKKKDKEKELFLLKHLDNIKAISVLKNQAINMTVQKFLLLMD